MSAQKTILCIEDEDDLRSDLAEELTAADYNVLQAANGSEALSVLEQNRPDLVLCDITMPGWAATTSSGRCANRASSPTCRSSS
jgi:CheY-like chemotaxis protein